MVVRMFVYFSKITPKMPNLLCYRILYTTIIFVSLEMRSAFLLFFSFLKI